MFLGQRHVTESQVLDPTHTEKSASDMAGTAVSGSNSVVSYAFRAHSLPELRAKLHT